MTTKTCEECFDEYEEGAGVAADDARGSVERFCSEECADDYERSLHDDDEDDDDDIDFDDDDE
jgi:hypothetical protein